MPIPIPKTNEYLKNSSLLNNNNSSKKLNESVTLQQPIIHPI